jgi:hypothetical protein
VVSATSPSDSNFDFLDLEPLLFLQSSSFAVKCQPAAAGAEVSIAVSCFSMNLLELATNIHDIARALFLYLLLKVTESKKGSGKIQWNNDFS